MKSISITVFAMTVALLILFGLCVLNGEPSGKSAKAAPLQDTPPCDQIAHAGALIIFRCEDEDTGNIIYANNIGFMLVVE